MGWGIGAVRQLLGYRMGDVEVVEAMFEPGGAKEPSPHDGVLAT